MKNTLPLSSFPLHGLLTIQYYFVSIVSFTMFFLILYKTYNLPYTSGMSAQQGIIIALFIIIGLYKIKLGIKANKTQDSLNMVIFIFMTIIGIVFSIYFMFLQYYVLLIQIIFFVTLIIFNLLELLFGFFSCWQFQSYQKQQ